MQLRAARCDSDWPSSTAQHTQGRNWRSGIKQCARGLGCSSSLDLILVLGAKKLVVAGCINNVLCQHHVEVATGKRGAALLGYGFLILWLAYVLFS